MERIRIDESQNGRGMFAKQDIPAGTVLFKITGKPISFEKTKELGEQESYCLQIERHCYIYPDYPFYFSNHACEPNCGIVEDMNFVTLREVKKGEELRWDYSTSMMERSWEMKCDCGSPQCRKRITDFDKLPRETQSCYLGKRIVMPYIVKMLQQ